MSDERRRHSRSRARDAEVAATSADPFADQDSSHNFAVRLLDTSASGACVVTTGRLRQGVPLLVTIELPGKRGRFKARAVVRWSTTVESKGRSAHVAGLEFERAVPELGPRVPGATVERPDDEPQRRHKRFVPEKVDIVLLPRSLLSKLGVKNNAARRLKDLSLGGAQIVSDRKLKPGDRVDLCLQFRYPPSKVTAEGVVRWCRRDTLSLEPRWNVGVLFREMDRDSDGRLRSVETIFLKK